MRKITLCLGQDYLVHEFYRKDSYHMTNITDCLLIQGSVNFVKGQMINSLGFGCYTVSFATTQPHCYNSKVVTDNM